MSRVAPRGFLGLRRRALVGLVLAFGCRALPSAIPLADTGVGRSVEDGALARNRVPFGERKSTSDDGDEEGSKADEVVSVVASSDAGDAGVTEAGTAAADAGDGGGLWAGEYFGSDRQATLIEGKTEKVDLDDKAHTRVEEPSPGVVVFTLVSSGDGQPICSVKAHASGERAELDSGEYCAPLFLMAPLTVEGKAKLDGDRLELDLGGHGEFPAEDGTIDMGVEYHFEGRRR